MPPDQFWSAVKVQSHREVYAAQNLNGRGVSTFVPRIETRRTMEPLFRSYIFALVVDGHWLAIERTYGVLQCIRFGDMPARVPDREIEALRARADEAGVIRLPPPPPKRVWARGDKVKILAGPFASFDGIHTGMSARAREIVLITMLGATRQVPVASHLVALR